VYIKNYITISNLKYDNHYSFLLIPSLYSLHNRSKVIFIEVNLLETQEYYWVRMPYCKLMFQITNELSDVK